MPSKPKLNDLQLVLLSHAAKTDAGYVFPLPASIKAEAASKEAKTLLGRAFLAEIETTSPANRWRSEDNIHFGLIITEAGKAAIGLGGDGADQASNEGTGADGAAAAEQATQAERRPRENSKIANVLTLLRRSEGVTLAGLVEATGWQQHTVRAAMTGLRKRGFELQRRKDGEETTVWFISEASE